MHIFYIKAKGDDGTTSDYARLSFSIDSTFIDNDGDGWSDEEELEYVTNPNNPNSLPLDTDDDHIPNEVDTDDDGDEISDTIENNLGSDPLDDSDVTRIYLSGNPYYLIDTTSDGTYNILYDLTSANTTSVEKQNNKYLIDKNADGSWDYIYNAETGAVTAYEKQRFDSIFIWIIVAILLTVIFLLVLLYFLKFRPQQERPIISAKKFARKKFYKKSFTFDSFDKDPMTKLNQTRQLLQSIQQDVKIHMEQLNKMEAKIKTPLVKTEEIRTPTLEEIREPVTLDDEELDVPSFERIKKIDEQEVIRDKKFEKLPDEKEEKYSEPETFEDEELDTVPYEERKKPKNKKSHNELTNEIDELLSKRNKK